MSNLHALLIGVDHYFEYPLPSGVYYPKLGGCVRDISKVNGFLTTRLQLDPANITLLTASIGEGRPQEPEAMWPTYANMVNAFKELADKAEPGDQVYIQYSGHGGRTTTMFPAIKGEGAFDEGLVPLDIGDPDNPNARYLRDVEIYNLLHAFVEKGVRLTVVFDCCHSGGATRKIGGARKRGIGRPDKSPPPVDSAVGDLAALVKGWPEGGGAKTRSVKNASSWLFEPKGYTLLAACRANESAFEFPFDGHESHGALTYWMLDTLAQAGPNTTWRMVADRVAAKVHGQFEEQTPMLQGEGDYVVFGAEQLDTRFGVGVLEVNKRSRQARIAAGEAHGVVQGTRFDVFPAMADADIPEKRKGMLELVEVDATESWASIVEHDGPIAISSGDHAIMLNTTEVRIQRPVYVAIEDAGLRSQVEAAIEASGQGFLVLAAEGEGADFLVDLHATRPHEFVIQDTAGGDLPYLRPALRVNDPNAITKLVKRLVHLAQFRNVQTLDMPDPRMAAKLNVELEGKEVNQPKDKLKIKITNTQKPDPSDPNNPDRVLNITVLVLSSDWSISQIYPSRAGAFETLDPGQTIPLELTAELSEDRDDSLDIIKVFATRSPTSFQWLELPPLDKPRQRKAATRSVIRDPLEQMLAMATKDQPKVRSVVVTSSPETDRGWTVAHQTIRVVRKSAEGEEETGDDDPPAPSDDDGDSPDLNETPPSTEPTPTRVELDLQALGVDNADEFQILVQFPEPAPLPAAMPADARGAGDVAKQIENRSRNAIDAAMSTIREMALQTDLMRKGIPGGSQPRMVRIKFGINMDLQLGAFLAKSNTGASMEVELEWARRSDDVLRVLRAETDVEGALFTDADAP